MAANALLDRGWGKAAQLVAVDGEIRQLVEVKLNVVRPDTPKDVDVLLTQDAGALPKPLTDQAQSGEGELIDRPLDAPAPGEGR